LLYAIQFLEEFEVQFVLFILTLQLIQFMW